MAALIRIALLTLLLALRPAHAAGPAIGDTPPQALGENREGAPVSLADYRGKIVVLTFWASWCGYCLKELPALDALQKQTGDAFLRVIAVNVKDDSSEYRSMMRQMRKFSLVQARDRSGKISDTFGVRGYPDLWIIDPRGQVAAHHSGYGEDSLQRVVDDIKAIVKDELARREAAPTSAG